MSLIYFNNYKYEFWRNLVATHPWSFRWCIESSSYFFWKNSAFGGGYFRIKIFSIFIDSEPIFIGSGWWSLKFIFFFKSLHIWEIICLWISEFGIKKFPLLINTWCAFIGPRAWRKPTSIFYILYLYILYYIYLDWEFFTWLSIPILLMMSLFYKNLLLEYMYLIDLVETITSYFLLKFRMIFLCPLI